MPVSDRDRRKMERLAEDLAKIERHDPVTGAAFDRAVAAANAHRQARGVPPLRTESEPPEEEFYRRARALGLRSRRR